MGADGRTVLSAYRVDCLYLLREHKHTCGAVENQNNASGIAAGSASSATEIWHRRMGHLNFHDLFEGHRSGAVRGMKLDEKQDVSCEICLRGKMTRTPFPRTCHRNTELLEIIHSDVCGPMRTHSHSNAKYFVTFIDDSSRWCEIKFIREKSQVFEVFKEFNAHAENRTGRKIKFLQSDNEGEYINKNFDQFLRENGISRRLTVTHTPEQNGTVRLWRCVDACCSSPASRRLSGPRLSIPRTTPGTGAPQRVSAEEQRTRDRPEIRYFEISTTRTARY